MHREDRLEGRLLHRPFEPPSEFRIDLGKGFQQFGQARCRLRRRFMPLAPSAPDVEVNSVHMGSLLQWWIVDDNAATSAMHAFLIGEFNEGPRIDPDHARKTMRSTLENRMRVLTGVATFRSGSRPGSTLAGRALTPSTTRWNRYPWIWRSSPAGQSTSTDFEQWNC